MGALSKFLVFFSIICIASLPAQSAENPTERGSVMLGGGISFTSIDYEGGSDRTNTLILAPSAMPFIFKGFSVGAELTFIHLSEGDDKAANHRYLGKLLYIVPTDNPIRPFVEGGFGFIRQSYDYDCGPECKGSENGWTLKLGLGIYAFLSKHYAIVAGFNYIHDNLMVSQGNEWTDDTIVFSLGFAGFVFK